MTQPDPEFPLTPGIGAVLAAASTEGDLLLPAPADRPTKQRSAARVAVVCAGRMLLFEDRDLGTPQVPGWWTTPGGGIDPGETSRAAAVRELFEETGLVTTEDALIGPIARRVVTHGYSDQILVQAEDFYRLELDEEFEVSTAGFTEGEKLTLLRHGWFAPDGLTDQTVWPAQWVQLFDAAPEQPIEWGEVEESTIPV